MVTLVIILCLNGSCVEHRAASGLTPTQCIVSGQMEAARLLALHPAYTLGGWRCIRGENV